MACGSVHSVCMWTPEAGEWVGDNVCRRLGDYTRHQGGKRRSRASTSEGVGGGRGKEENVKGEGEGNKIS